MLEFEFLFGVCEVTGLAGYKSNVARTIEVTRKKGRRMDCWYLISSLIQLPVVQCGVSKRLLNNLP